MAIQIRGGQIKSASITATQLTTGIINNSNLLGSSVIASAALANDAVISSKIANGAIDNTLYLADDVVTSAKIDLSSAFVFSGAVSVPSPTADAHAATKAYVDSTVQGVHWKESVVCASTANVDVSSAPSSIDGVTLQTDQRILLKDQTTQSQNGIYEFAGAGAAMQRTADANIAAELEGAAVFVRQGSTHADQGFICTTDSINLGVTNIVFTQFTGLGSITAGNGLSKSGSTLAVDLVTNSGLEFSSAQLRVKAGFGVQIDGTDGTLAVKTNGSTLALSGSGLSVGTITSSELGANSVTANAIADGSIDSSAFFAANVVDAAAIASNAVTSVKINSSAVTSAKIASAAVDENKLASSVAGNGLAGGAGSALSVSVDDATIEINSDSLRLKDGGIANAKLSSGCIATANVQNDAITAALIGAAFFQEVADVSNSSTGHIDLARAVDSGFFAGVQVYKNGLALLNQTAFSGSASTNDEFTVANNGSGSVCRVNFGANVDNGDKIVIVYFT